MKKNRKNAFTLIELLAVIIILGILMIIAIPSVTRYINDSRKSAYVDTAKQVISAAKNLVNSGKLEMYDTNVTYYIPNSCIRVENGEKAKSPYGEFIDDKTYVVVTYDGKGYDYYWVSLDDTGTGVKELRSVNELNEDNIESDLTNDDIKDNIGIGGREKVEIYNADCTVKNQVDAVIENKIIFDANGGTFNNGKTINERKYYINNKKYSYTSNLDINGLKISDYGNNWNNANISGSDRGDLTKAHVVTIDGATSLHVTITYGTEGPYYDYACIFKGSHPEYTSGNYCNNSISGRLGGNGYLSLNNKKEYDVDDNSITFIFKSNGSGVGDGYGYYATIVSYNTNDAYLEPSKNGSNFLWWKTNDGKIYSTTEVESLIPNENMHLYAQWGTSSYPLCRRARVLHSDICNRTDGKGCNETMTTGQRVIFGNNNISNNQLNTGDAFDCDVNGDGMYDASFERFYYVIDTIKNNEPIAILIYYNDTINQEPYVSGSGYAYAHATDIKNIDSTSTGTDNWHGPVTIYKHLPSTTKWSNSKIVLPGTRQITNENNGLTTNSGANTIQSFTYTDKAARLLTYQEIKNSSCGSNITTKGDLLDCLFLLENTNYTKINKDYYWSLETPLENKSNLANKIYFVMGYYGMVSSNRSDQAYLARPAIEVKLSDIDY